VQPSNTNFAFDERVVHLYHQQRQHPPVVARAVGAAIVAQAPADQPILEIGVGTGRIALPVASSGGRVIGFDVSPHMLREVTNTANALATAGTVALAQADMHQMPFPAQQFGAVLAVHVLHLAQDWQQVIREIVRVLRPDGIFIQGDDWMDPQSVVGKLRDELRRHAVRLDPALLPPAATANRAAFMAELGATETHEVIAAEWTFMLSPAERLEIIEKRIDAESWILKEDLFAAMMAHLRDYAAQQWADLDTPQPVTRRFIMKITRGNWKA
jgi:SAM-dependent methyltransferase